MATAFRISLMLLLRKIPGLVLPWRLFRSLVARANLQNYTLSGSAPQLPADDSAAPTASVEPPEVNSGKYSVGRNPLISIVIPFYADEAYLGAALESVRQQTYGHFECFVVDDAAIDDSRIIATEFCRKDRRFRVLTHKANAGLAAARNTGLAEAKGEYITFMDADDMMATDSLEKRANQFQDYLSYIVAGVYCHQKIVSDSFFEIRTGEVARNPSPVKDFIGTGGDCPFSCHQPLLRSEVIRKFGGFNETLTQAEDWDLWLRIMRHGYIFIPTPSIGVFYRMKSYASMVSRAPIQHLANSKAMFDAANRDLQDNEIIFDVPFVYRKPWVYYQQNVKFAQRALSFLGSGPIKVAYFCEW